MAIDHLPATAVEAVPSTPPQPTVSPYVVVDIAAEKTEPAPDASKKVRAAKATGRGVGAGARHLTTGLTGTTRAGWRYVRATDRVESIEPSTPSEWDYIHGVRRKRWITAAATVGGGVVANCCAWLGMVAGAGFTAEAGLEAAMGTESAAVMVAAMLYGRHLTRRAALEAGPTVPAISAVSAISPAAAAVEDEAVVGAGASELMEALAAIKVPDGSSVVSNTPGPDGTSITVVNLPVTVTSLKAKAEDLAGALGRDTTMVDITKGAHANQAVIWVANEDPYEAPRPSPLMNRHTPLDTWVDGAPVSWGKRGNTVSLPITNSSFVIGGGTRSGKGVGAANLVTAAAFDPRINLRIVAGKNNGEWDPAAKAGVAATYFKPNPHRLNALLEALWAEKDRRERILGEAGKSKMTAASIMALGGIELLIIDELATYTRPGNELREENLKLLTDLSAVAAAAGILMVLITQYPEVAVIPQALAMNCTTRWAMRVDNATQSNAILGDGSAGSGRDASRFDPPRPGLGWLINPFAGVTDLARSFDLDEDERGEITMLMERAARFREAAGRLASQWDDPIERALAERTGLSSAAGGPQHNGVPGRVLHLLDPQESAAYEALADAVEVMDQLGRDAQIGEMAAELEMPAERLGELLRKAGAGRTEKIWVPDGDGGKARVNGYRREQLKALLDGAAVA